MSVITAPRSTRSLPRTVLRRPALLLGIVGAIVGFAGSWIPSYWGDEAASVMSAERSLPSLVSELATIDGVHGLYYGFLHVWVSAFGASEFSTRLPSAIAVGFMVAGVVVLVRMLASPRAAILAGVILILLPRATSTATEARSYALGAAAAVWVTVLLVNILRRRISTRGAWVVYGLAMSATIYLFLYLGLLLLVHAVVMAVLHRDRLRPWLWGAGTAAVASIPIVLVGYAQRQQIGFLARRNYATAPNVLSAQWFGSTPVAILCWALIAIAVIAVIVRFRSRFPLLIVSLAWLVIPTAVLLIGNATVSPMYNVRYLTFSTPAAAILIAMGVMAIAGLATPRWRIAIAASLVVLLALLCAPGYIAQRKPFAKDGGSDLRQVSEYIQGHAIEGDAIIFDQGTKPSRDPRLALRLYPANFTAVDDIGLVTDFGDTNGLWDVTAPVAQIDLSGVSTLWAVELGKGSTTPPDIRYLETHGYYVESTTLIHRSTIYHLTRD